MAFPSRLGAPGHPLQPLLEGRPPAVLVAGDLSRSPENQHFHAPVFPFGGSRIGSCTLQCHLEALDSAEWL